MDPAEGALRLPAAAVAAAAMSLRRRLLRTLVFMLALCTAIAVLLAVINRGHFGVQLVYSFSIGLSCWAFIGGIPLLVGWVARRARLRRGEAPTAIALRTGWRSMLALLVVGVTLGPLLGLSIGDALTGYRTASMLDLGAPSTRITFVITLLASLASLFAITALERLSAERARAESAQRQAAENQLKLLESQLEPHMLFNTLANLRVLIAVDPARAQEMLDRLIDFLRATLNASRTGSHPLAAEFDRIGDYLALMAVRMGPRLQTRLDLPQELRGLPVPPLLLQPLVENSIRHGLEPQVEGGLVELSARRDGDSLVLTVRDTGVGLPPGAAPRETGFGLRQVRERLATLYGGAARVEIEPAGGPDGGTVARIALPIRSPS